MLSSNYPNNPQPIAPPTATPAIQVGTIARISESVVARAAVAASLPKSQAAGPLHLIIAPIIIAFIAIILFFAQPILKHFTKQR